MISRRGIFGLFGGAAAAVAVPQQGQRIGYTSGIYPANSVPQVPWATSEAEIRGALKWFEGEDPTTEMFDYMLGAM